MMYVFIVHWMLRKGLSAEFVPKTSEYAYDDLPDDCTMEEAREMARSDFKHERYACSTGENNYYITDIVVA